MTDTHLMWLMRMTLALTTDDRLLWLATTLGPDNWQPCLMFNDHDSGPRRQVQLWALMTGGHLLQSSTTTLSTDDRWPLVVMTLGPDDRLPVVVCYKDFGPQWQAADCMGYMWRGSVGFFSACAGGKRHNISFLKWP